MERETVNLLVTLDENYIRQLNIMLFSMIRSNPECEFDVYLLHTAIPDAALESTRKILAGNGRLIPIKVYDLDLDRAPTSNRYPKEIYYRIFAARYLPETLERVLYLDPDLIVNGSILTLYHTPLPDYYFAAATHINALIHKFNSMRLFIDDDNQYINSGVMLMNLDLLRKEQRFEDVFNFMEKHKNLLMLPDQDIISGLYGSKVYTVDPFRYNMTERLFQMHSILEKGMNLDWVRKYSIIIHYCGRNKPWKGVYLGSLDVFYKETLALMEQENVEP